MGFWHGYSLQFTIAVVAFAFAKLDLYIVGWSDFLGS
jgi:hypothetical protein